MTRSNSKDDAVKGAEYLLVGELGETEGSISINARLIDAATGTVIATAQTTAPSDSAARAAEAFRYSAFQSPYGITLGIDASIIRPRGETTTSPAFFTAFVAYRVARPLRIGAGFANLGWNDYYNEEVPGTGGNGSYKRRYSLNGTGPRIFFDVGVSLHF